MGDFRLWKVVTGKIWNEAEEEEILYINMRFSLSIDTYLCVSILNENRGQLKDWVSIHISVYRYSPNTLLKLKTEYRYILMCIDTHCKTPVSSVLINKPQNQAPQCSTWCTRPQITCVHWLCSFPTPKTVFHSPKPTPNNRYPMVLRGTDSIGLIWVQGDSYAAKYTKNA